MGNTRIKGRHHVLVVPHQGLGHINPLFNLCKMIASRRPDDIHMSFLVTEEWAGLLQTEPNLDNNNNNDNNINVISMPNFMPPALATGLDPFGCLKHAVKVMEEKVKELLDSLQHPPDLIIADTLMSWAVGLGETRNIPVASFWTGSASHFTAFYHHQLIVNSQYYPLLLKGSAGEKRIDFIPGIPSIRLADLPGEFQIDDKRGLEMLTTMVAKASKAKCIIFRTTKELEESALAAIKSSISIPIYPVGPTIPISKTLLDEQNKTPDYIKWLNTQKQNSVLYISQGSLFSASDTQIDELVSGLKDSKIPFLWVARDQADRLNALLGDQGKAVSWCDQMRTLSHPSIGGFLTHCGLNSVLEAAFVGVPFLTFPLAIDQILNSKIIVEDWGTGWRVKNNFEDFVTKDKISTLFKKLMDSESRESKDLASKCKKFKELLLLGVGKDGSTTSLGDFLSKFFS